MGRRPADIDYRLPRDIYMRTLWYIRGFRRWSEECESILEGSPAPPDGMPRGSRVSDPVYVKAARLVDLSAKMRPVQVGLDKIPTEYRDGVLRAIIERERYPDYAGFRTWLRWRHRLVYYVAEALGWLEK